MNIEQARTNMLTQQIRACKVLDDKVLDVLSSTPREFFVPKEYEHTAFADFGCPIGHDQVMMSPMDEAKLLQEFYSFYNEIAVDDFRNVLEIGTGTGYFTAALSKLAGKVTSVDIFADFTEQASGRLRELKIDNVNLMTGDALRDISKWEFDDIVLTGSLPFLPDALKENFPAFGSIHAIIGNGPIMDVVRYTQQAKGEWSEEVLYQTRVPALINAPEESKFSF